MEHRQKTEERAFYLETSVFPLLDVKDSMKDIPTIVECPGTCFLIKMGQQDVFVTAKHLLSEKPDKHNLYLAYNTSEGRSSYLKVKAACVNHVGEDTSFFLPTAEMKAEYEQILVPMEWLRCSIPVGQGVLVYGFPNSGQQSGANAEPMVNIQRTRYEGKVLGIDHDCPLPVMKTIYQIDVPSPRGLSGSPVMVIHKETVAVAGYIIGEQTINGRSVATAADSTPFVEIERLLIDASRKLAPKLS